MALFGAAACGSDCKSNECPAIDIDDAGIVDDDAGIQPPPPPDKSLAMKYLERIAALVKKNVVRIASCSEDESLIKGQVEPYLALIEPALPVIEEELVSGRLDIKWDKITPCLDEILGAAEAMDALADSGDICTMVDADVLFPMLTREKIPACSALVEDAYKFYTAHQEEFENAHGFVDSLYIFLPYIADPKLEIGQECALNYECKNGFCAGNTPLTCGGVCVALKDEGEHCSSSTVCADGLLCYRGTCTAPGTEEGDYCDGSSLPCAKGFFCFDYECRPKLATGESYCIDGSHCSSSYCESGFAEEDEESGTYKCAAKKANGQPCNSDSQCVSDFCDEDYPVNEDYYGVCADMILGFPGDACIVGTACMTECDLSLETPICATSRGLSDIGGDCRYDGDCVNFAECVGYSEQWNDELEDYDITLGKCYAQLNKGDKCDLSLGTDLCKSGLSCEADDPTADPEPGSTPLAHCVAQYLEKGEMCAVPDGREESCNPATSFCDAASEAELQKVIPVMAAEVLGAYCESLDDSEYEACLADQDLLAEITEEFQAAADEGEIRFCHELKKNGEDCVEMNECSSGYCDFLFGSYLCLDFPDVSQLNVCQIPGAVNLLMNMR